ncbi:hypothetical protein BJX99DRAFT_238949 [Aspergillus californicus]
MFTKSSLLLATAGSALVAALPGVQRSSPGPCARISQQVAQASEAGGSTNVPGALAVECLQSMPFDAKRGAAFVEDLKKYMQWQSDADVLHNPPTSYLSPPVDFWGTLEYLQQEAAANNFANQFEFDTALADFVFSVKDGHLSLIPCSYMPFSFVAPESLVSISSDGLELPEVYTFNDAEILKNNSGLVSPVETINGVDVVSFLEEVGEPQAFQDPDARYNNVFHARNRFLSSAQVLGGFYIPPSNIWPGVAEYTLGYTNGTTHKVEVNAAARSGSFEFSTGQELYDSFCLPQSESTSTPASSSPTPSPSSSPASSTPASSTPTSSPTATVKPTPTGYPKAAVRDDNNLLAGYLIDEPELEDTAVLSVPTFSISGVEGETDIVSNLAIKFIQKAVDAEKKKIILDLSSNPGGDTAYAFDLFRLFFPNTTPYWSTRFRAHEAFRLIQKVGYELDEDDSILDSLISLGFFGMGTPNQNASFETLEELYGPEQVLGVNMTNPNSFDFDLVSTDLTPIHGYGGIPNNYTTAPFAAEDILIITDGACSSSCPIFVELMKYQGVKTLSFGGRPQYGPMQAMGGTRGGQVLASTTLNQVVSGVLAYAEENELLTPSELQTLEEVSPAEEGPLQVGLLQMNFRDAFSMHDKESVMPLQFVYEPAHCRLFYTLENVFSPASTWTAAKRAVWGGGECVAGSRFDP